MPSNVVSWPEGFGFNIYGKGPSYIIAVERSSAADESGLKPGDQILQVEDSNVADISSEQIVEYVSKMKSPPPSLGVISRLKEVTMRSSSSEYKLFGLTLIGTLPVVINHVEPESPAYHASLKSHDILIQVEGKYVTSHTQARYALEKFDRCGGVCVSIIPVLCESDSPKLQDSLQTIYNKKIRNTAGQTKANTFLTEMKEAFGSHPLEIDKVVRAIQSYSKNKDIGQFTTDISSSFQHASEGWKLVESLRFFIPNNHKDLYDLHIQKYWVVHKEQNKRKHILLNGFVDKEFSSVFPPDGHCDVGIQHDTEQNCLVESTRSVIVLRGSRGFGLTVCGHNPVTVQDVDKGSAADEAGLKNGDRILALNGIDLRHTSHIKAIQLIQGSGSMPTLVIQSTSGSLSTAATSSVLLHNRQQGIYCSDLNSNSSNLNDHRKDYSSSPKSAFKLEELPYPTIFNEGSIADPDEKKETESLKSASSAAEKQILETQVKNLLTGRESKVIKSAIDEFAKESNMDAFIYKTFPILNGRNVRYRLVWQFIFLHLTKDEQDHLRKKLKHFANVDLPDFVKLTSTTNESENRQSASNQPRFELQGNHKTALNREHNDNIKLDYMYTASSSNYVDLQTIDSCQPMTSQHRRHKRCRTVENILVSPCEHAKHTVNTSKNTPQRHQELGNAEQVLDLSDSSDKANIGKFYDEVQQLRRRQKRAHLNSTRRCRSIGVVTSNAIRNEYNDNQFRNTQADSFNNIPSKKMEILSTNIGTLPQEKKQPRKKAMEIYTTTTTTEAMTKSIQKDSNHPENRQKNELEGDKQKTSKKKSKPASTSTLPASSIDDITTKNEFQPEHDITEKNNPVLKSSGGCKIVSKNLKGGELQRFNINERNQDNKAANAIKAKSEEKETVKIDKNENRLFSGKDASFHKETTEMNMQDSVSELLNESLIFSSDDAMKNKGYLNSIKKRLTFSRPPKSNDTDTFLCELSAQFDEEMNLLDDLEFEEEKLPEVKYGEKWSYLPKDECAHPILAEQQSMSQSQTTPILGTNVKLSNPPVEATEVSDQLPSQIQDSEKPVRERVRRRRRRNAAVLAKQDEEFEATSEHTAHQDPSIRRTSDPLPANDVIKYIESPVAYQDDKVIYDVPKPVATQRRAHVNIEKRSRRSRANRPRSLMNKRNSTEIRMHVWTDNDLAVANSENKGITMRSSSPVEQGSFFEVAKKKNYRVSGISMDMEDIFSEAEEDLQKNRKGFSFPPRESPPLPVELTRCQDQENVKDSDEVYAPLHQEVLALGLAYDENEQVEEEYHIPQTSANENTDIGTISPGTIPPPPPVPSPPPVPPPPPLSPPVMFKNTPPASPVQMSVKRINWEKIEPVDLGNTVWGQLGEDNDTINDVVKYLDLEEHFAMKRGKTLQIKKTEIKKDVLSILAHKKAYNTSILLAHLKLSHREICNCLLFNGSEITRKRMDASHYKQLLLYAPDLEETKKLQAFSGEIGKLNEADFLAVKLINIPGYQLRLKALVFKHSFIEKEEEIRKNLEVIQRASLQLRKSKKLTKILEFVLAMGNYMNRGHIRISKATGFRIHFLADMDSTKTSDNKLTFLHILARAVMSKFPDVCTFSEELTDVKNASRVVYNSVLEELHDIRKVWLHIRDNLHETSSKNKQDKFKVAMETCLVRTNGSIKRLEQLHNATVKEFNKAAQFFGENPKNIAMQQFFKIFEEFTRKFEKSHSEIRHLVKSKPLGSTK